MASTSLTTEKSKPFHYDSSIFDSLAESRPQVFSALVDCATLLLSKGHDYTTKDNDFENFEEQARIAGIEMRQVFRSILAQKLNREKVVYSKGKAKHESRMDTIVDIANYGILWLAMEMDNHE